MTGLKKRKRELEGDLFEAKRQVSKAEDKAKKLQKELKKQEEQ